MDTMSTEAHGDRRPRQRPPVPMARIIRGQHAGRVGALWRNSGVYQVQVDLGPDGGFVDVPSTWVEEIDEDDLDGWRDGTVGDSPS